jgi:hypothetical protein
MNFQHCNRCASFRAVPVQTLVHRLTMACASGNRQAAMLYQGTLPYPRGTNWPLPSETMLFQFSFSELANYRPAPFRLTGHLCHNPCTGKVAWILEFLCRKIRRISRLWVPRIWYAHKAVKGRLGSISGCRPIYARFAICPLRHRLYVAVQACGALIGFLIGAYLADAIGRKWTFMTSAVVTIIMTLVYLYVPTGNTGLLVGNCRVSDQRQRSGPA